MPNPSDRPADCEFEQWADDPTNRFPVQKHEFGRYDTYRECARAAWQACATRIVARLRARAATIERDGKWSPMACELRTLADKLIKEFSAMENESDI
jgi:hypothetical protein